MVSKLAKAIGFVGGVAALVWAMRDRFISVAVSREPQPPSFRVGPSDGEVSLESIAGIGPTYASRLRDAGFATVADLAAADAERVAGVAGVSVDRASTWLAQART